MADKYITLSSFKYGIDARREVLASLPGTLITLINGRINEGGEIEQRKSFTRSTNAFPSNTFGLQDTDQGLMTFGGDASPNAALPAGVTYQRLLHPTGWTLSGLLPIPVIMVGVIYSCNFLGKAFVLAQYSDNGIYAYYNGTLVGSSRNGQVLSTGGGVESVVDLANDLAAQVPPVGSGWLATPNYAVIRGTVTAHLGSVIVMSPPSVHFTPVPSKNSTNGILSATLVDQNHDGTAAIGATAAFTLNAGTNGTVAVTSSGTLVSGGTVAFNSTLAQTAQDIVDTINLFTGTTGYSAVKSGTATITVFAPTSLGNYTANLDVVTTGDITTVTATPVTGFILNASATTVDVTQIVKITQRTATVVGHVQMSTQGQLGTVQYQWDRVSADGTTVITDNGISLSVATGSFLAVGSGAYVSFSANLHVPGSVQGYFRCTARDNGPPASTLTKIIFVTLEVDNNA